MRIQKNRFYRAYAIGPVRFQIFGFCLTKMPLCFVHVYVCFCFYLQLRVLCLKYPFYTTSVYAYKSAHQFIMWVPCHSKHVYRSLLSSLNVRGLGEVPKRKEIFNWLRKKILNLHAPKSTLHRK